MDQFNYFGISKKLEKKLYFEKTRHLSAKSFTGFISIPIWIPIMTKLYRFQMKGASCQEIL